MKWNIQVKYKHLKTALDYTPFVNALKSLKWVWTASGWVWLTLSIALTLSFLNQTGYLRRFQPIIGQFHHASTEPLKKDRWGIGFIAVAVIAAGSVWAICLSDGRFSSVSAWTGASTLIYSWVIGGVNSQTISHVCPVTPVNPQNSMLMRAVSSILSRWQRQGVLIKVKKWTEAFGN